MRANSSITIYVGAKYGRPEPFTISPIARERCAFLLSLTNNSSLIHTRVHPFRIIIRCLTQGAHILSEYFDSPDLSTTVLLFARTWALAARTGLPALQDKLTVHMRDFYLRAKWERKELHVDTNMALAFRHLEKHCGSDSHAERFLISFIGGLAHDELQLITDLRLRDIKDDVYRAVLKDARASNRDWIRDDVARFMVECESPVPVYKQLVVRGPERDHGNGVRAVASATAYVHGDGGNVVTATATAGVSVGGGDRICPYYGDTSNGMHQDDHNPPVFGPSVSPSIYSPSPPSPLRIRRPNLEPGHEVRRRRVKNDYETETNYCGLFLLFNGRFFGRKRSSRRK
ncbi:hypothetical protein P280DRAFT_531707 [Massarina eburnea CBS 473.64]|uniref:BTB domain-containing protein n=1 Tax=Massarina eburnea CBS 473.64 TaxID=1395130 RepID=A0A6A6SCG7_9PLEO|nr:hypothetical protein P280DRAFT_531707 [Massarina eburnea CBS 473.64]